MRRNGHQPSTVAARAVAVVSVAALAASACSGGNNKPPQPDAGVPSRFTATLAKPIVFPTADHMRASLEMQVSGEPFAQLLGYNLAGFNRFAVTTDLYTDQTTFKTSVDPLGYTLAVETYEYSKQPMNNLSFESGAGLSLQFGPVLNPGPTQMTGDPAYSLLLNRLQLIAAETGSAGPPGTNYVTTPAPTANPLNYYGWPGYWPVYAEFTSFDPSIPAANADYTSGCTMTHGTFGIYGGGNHMFSPYVGNYECDYNSLNLTPRDAHVTKVLTPDALGYSSWKQGLWVTNYWQTMHDTNGNQVTLVAASDIAQVGQYRNTVVGQYPDPTDPTGVRLLTGSPGVYLGDVPIEGWQGLTMLDENDNKAQLLLSGLLTSDGKSLGGLTVAAADAYSYDSPLEYFPAAVAVTETPTDTTGSAPDKYFPQPTAFAIQDGQSRLRDLSGLIGGMAEIFNLTNAQNAQVGGSDPLLATFDGDPEPADDGTPNGEATLHDRTLGVIKVAVVDLDRLHYDAGHQVLVDSATVSGSTVTRGTTVSTVEVAESILALRNAYRALNGSLQLYSNDTPDTIGAPSALDSAALTGASYTGTLANHIIDLIRMQATFLTTNLVSSSGQVANSYDLAKGAADTSPTDLAAEMAAIRGLLEAYLVTSDASYRQAAQAVYADLLQRFWLDDLQIFMTTAGVKDKMAYTPIRFGLLTGGLRQYYKLVASQPGHATEATDLLAKLLRSYKLVVNGWDEANGDSKVSDHYPTECTGAGLEMGERALTGELGNLNDHGDRDKDCVKEISSIGLPAALASEIDLVPR
jgi:hypothetical protein